MDSLHGWVIRLFRDFAHEVEALRHFARTGQPPAGTDPDQVADGNRLPFMVRRLTELLARLEHAAGQRGGGMVEAERFQECRYALVALADDLMLSIDWPGRTAWLREPLEMRLFGSQKAGQEIFERIDQLLARDVGADRELAVVYLLTLSLGFRGPLQNATGGKRIAQLKGQLFSHYFHRSPEAGRLTGQRLIPASYRHILVDSAPGQLPYLRPWLFTAAAVVLVWLAAAQLAWVGTAGPLEQMAATLLRLAGVGR
jgi:type VI secretion system protein ImpK